MQKVCLALALALVVNAASAQVAGEILFDQEHFLRNESLNVRVRIDNFSGQSVAFGGTPDWMEFVIQDRNGISLPKLSEVSLPKSFTVESSKSVSVRTDLMPYFNLHQPGQYSIRARIKIPAIQKEFITEPKTFDIVAGSTIWEREVGVPSTTPPVVRKYALQQATFVKETLLYVRVTDPGETQVFRVLPLGAVLSFSRPEALVDNSSQLHVLFQYGPRSFLYSIITPDGERIVRQTWDYASARPRLQSAEDGRVIVAGGTRRILLSDLPPPRVAETNDSRQSK